MDFNDTPEEAAFRKEVRGWLEKNARRKTDRRGSQGRDIAEQDLLARAKQWQAKKAEAGYAAITWPKDWGGMGGTPIQSVIYSQEESNFVAPNGPFVIGLGMCIPTLIKHGSDEHRQRYVQPALKGEEIWCQLFSEPSAGSDVGASRTRAVKDGDEWVVNGQKIWTSGAHYADFGLLLARTDPDVPKHKGLTMFFLDMKSPGVEVRPIKQASGDSNFNEVYFTDVRIPDSQRLGDEGEGWKVAITTLMNERMAAGQGGGFDVDDMMELAREIEFEDGPAIKDRAVREQLADYYVRSAGLKYTRFRTITALSKGQTPGPEGSIYKIISASQLQDMASYAMDLMGEGGLVHRGLHAKSPLYHYAYFWGAGIRIAGGSDEILRNIIAERVLGLPGDIRVDKDVPFKDLPTGSQT